MEHEETGLDSGGSGRRAKHVVLVLCVVFAAVLAVIVGRQMNAQAMAVVVGVACGMAASVPTSLLLFVALTSRDRDRVRASEQGVGKGHYPPVVVIQGGGSPAGLPPGAQAGHWPAPLPGPPADRQWHVVGGDDLLQD
jgi:hypothetical protein